MHWIFVFLLSLYSRLQTDWFKVIRTRLRLTLNICTRRVIVLTLGSNMQWHDTLREWVCDSQWHDTLREYDMLCCYTLALLMQTMVRCEHVSFCGCNDEAV